MADSLNNLLSKNGSMKSYARRENNNFGSVSHYPELNDDPESNIGIY